MIEKSISSSYFGIIIKKIIAVVVIIFIQRLWFKGNIESFITILVASIATFAALLYILSSKTSFTKDYMKFGKRKVPFNEIKSVKTTGYNDVIFLVFILKNKSFFTKFRLVEPKFPNMFVMLIKIIFKKEPPPIFELMEMLEEKGLVKKTD